MNTDTKQISPRARHRARIIAMQALYQAELSDNSISEILAESRIANDHFKTDWLFAEDLILKTYQMISDLDKLLIPELINPIEKTNPIERQILRLGLYELKHHIEIPYKVIISEYVDIAMAFGATDGEKFVNKVLDALAQNIRAIEFENK